MATITTLQKNFLKYGTPLPSTWARAKHFFSFRKKADTWIPATASMPFGFGSTIQDVSKQNTITHAWNKNATVYAIVRKIAKTCAYAPWGPYRVKDEQEYKRYKALSAQQHTAKSLGALQIARVKSLEPVQNNKLNDLYNNPNPLMSGSEYTEALITYKLLTGDAYEWGRLMDIGVNRGKPGEFWPLPAQYMQIYTNGRFPAAISKYMLFGGGEPKEFTPEEVLHTKYFNPNYSITGAHLYGFSPLQAAWLTVQEDNDAKDAGIEVLQNRGPRKLITVKNDAIQTAAQAKEQAGRLKERWREEMLQSRGGIVLMPGEGAAVDVGLSINDLKILEISNYTQDDLCNVYGVWSGLFNSQSNQKYDNVGQFRKDFIINTILPELNALREARNYKLRTDWGYKGSGIVVDYDPTVYIELQSDMKALAEWLEIAWWFSPNKKLIYMNETPEDNPAMDRVYIPSNYVPIDEVGMEPSPLPETGIADE